MLGLNGAGKTTLLRLLSGIEPPDTGEVNAGHGRRLGDYAQEEETPDHERTILENRRPTAAQAAQLLGATQGAGVLNTAYIERLTGTFRQHLARLGRRTRHLARRSATICEGRFLVRAA